MALAQEDIHLIESLIRKTLADMPNPEKSAGHARYDQELRERTIRVEEELKHQRELMLEGFKQMEKRFEQVDRRFEQVDKRFEQLYAEMNRRFESVDKRFEQQHQEIKELHREILGVHHEIKLLMRWSFGALLAVGGLIVAVLRLVA